MVMAITWARLRRRDDRNEQVAGIEPDEHGSRASEKRRERQERLREQQKVRQEVRREFPGRDPRDPGAWGMSGGGF